MKATLKPSDRKLKDLPIDFTVILKHSWNRTLLEFGDVVRIIGTFCKENDFCLNFNELDPKDEKDKIKKGRLLVLEPEILIPSTSISTASPCPRVPLLRELFKNAEGDPNYALTLGNVIHLLFQKILENINGSLLN